MQDDILQEITKRYLDAYYKLYGDRKVSSKGEFCEVTSSFAENFSKMEKGKMRVNLKTVRLLVDKFGISSDWILKGEGEFYSQK